MGIPTKVPINLVNPTPAASTDLSDYVDLTSAQTISGAKTFTDYGKYILADNTSETQFMGIRVYDSNNKVLASFRGKHYSNGTRTSQLGVFGLNSEYGVIECSVNSSGTVYTSAPTPDTSDNSTKIATTAFVNNRIATLENALNFVDLPSMSSSDTMGLVLKPTHSASNSNEGSQIVMEHCNNGSYQDIIIDSYQNMLRIFNPGGTNGKMFRINFVDNDTNVDCNGGKLENVMAKSFSNTSLYIKYYSGLLICCGWVSNVATGTEVTYQVAFVQPPFVSFARYGTTNSTVPVYFSSNIATKCTLASASNITGYWQAIGYWK